MGNADKGSVAISGKVKISSAAGSAVDETFSFVSPCRSVSRFHIVMAAATTTQVWMTPGVANQGVVHSLIVNAKHSWVMKINDHTGMFPLFCRGLFAGEVNSTTVMIANFSAVPNEMDIIIGQRGSASEET